MTGGSRFTADNIAGEYTPPSGDLFQGFEGTTYEDWTATGDAFGDGPARGNVPPQGGVGGFLGNGLAGSFHGEDRGTGTLTSPAFTMTKPYLNFLVGGGNHPYPGTETNKPVAVNLVVGGAVVRTKTGKDGETLNWTNWNVAALKGKTARIDIVDANTGGWGHINADQFTFADEAASSRGVRVNVAVLLGADVGDMSLMEASRLRFVRSEASGGAPAVAALASKRQCATPAGSTRRVASSRAFPSPRAREMIAPYERAEHGERVRLGPSAAPAGVR